jgi:hypothetical protein
MRSLDGRDDAPPRIAERRDRRYNVRLTAEAGNALEEMAAELEAPPTTVAARIIEEKVLPGRAPIARRRPAPNKK